MLPEQPFWFEDGKNITEPKSANKMSNPSLSG